MPRIEIIFLLLISIIIGPISYITAEGNVDLTVKFLLSTSKNPSMLCSSPTPSCAPKALRLDITVKTNKKPPSSSFIDIDSVTMTGAERGRHYGRFDRRISVSSVASPVTSVELSLQLTPRCSEKCGKPIKSANGTFKVNLMAYKHPQMTDTVSFSPVNGLLQIDAIVNYKYKCSAKLTGSNCHCYVRKDECGSNTYICQSKSTTLCCFTQLNEEGYTCDKEEFTTMSLTTLTTNATTDIITEELKDNLIPDKSTSIAEYSEEYGNSTIANETFFDSFSPQISSISSTEHHIVTVAVGCTVAVLLAAFLIGLLTYHLAKKKVVSPAQMVTFYYEEGPYAEIESDKWQNIVSLCTTMEDVEAEIHRSMAHLYAASSICSSAYEGVHKSISAGNMLKHEYDNVYENNTVERSKKLKRLKNLRLKPLGYKTSSSASNIRYNSEDVIGDKTVTKSLFDELQEVKALEEGIYEDTKSFSSGSYASVDRKNPYDSVCGGSRKSNSLNSNCKTSPLTTLAEVHQTTPEQSQIPEENSCKHCSNLKRVPIVRKNPQEADEVRKSLLEHKKPADSKCQCDSDNVSTETDGTVIKTAETNKNSDNLTANATGILNLTYDDIEETLW